MLLLEDVRKTFIEPNGHLLPVLDIPRFALERGEQMVLLGRSGCGKTTLLHCIAGISSVDSGAISLDGVNLARLSEPARDRFRAARMGYVFQTFNLLPAFNALENVLLGMTFARGKRDVVRARQLLDRVGLSHRSTHTPRTMSVGEQQRVAVLPGSTFGITEGCYLRLAYGALSPETALTAVERLVKGLRYFSQ